MYFQFAHQPAIEEAKYENGTRWDPIRGLYRLVDPDSIRWRILNELLWTEAQPLQSDTRQAKALTSLALSLTRDAPTLADSLQKIQSHLAQHMRWDGRYSRQVFRDPASLYASRVGSSGEINSLLIHLLQLAGLPADACFLQPHSQGNYSPLMPIQVQFTHLVASVPTASGYQLLDATHPHLPFNQLPTDQLHGRYYRPFGPDSGWQRLPIPPTQKAEVRLYLTDWQADSVHFSLEATLRGYEAARCRSIPSSEANRQIPRLLGLPAGSYQLTRLFQDEPESFLLIQVEGNLALPHSGVTYAPFQAWMPPFPMLWGYDAKKQQFLYPLDLRYEFILPPPPGYEWEPMQAQSTSPMDGPEGISTIIRTELDKQKAAHLSWELSIAQLRWSGEPYTALLGYQEEIANRLSTLRLKARKVPE